MAIKTAKVKGCDVEDCAYNMKNRCHAIAITVGGGSSPICDTSVRSANRAGLAHISAVVGACKVENCLLNKNLQCVAEHIQVRMHTNQAECATFEER